MNYYAANVKAGYTFDPEDGRTTHRYRLAHGILQELGVSPRVEHYEMCHHHPKNRYVTHKEGGCWSQCKTIWPEWVTDDMFELAWTAADARQTLTGLVNRLKRLDGKAS